MTRRVRFTGWTGDAFRGGSHDGTVVRDGVLALGTPTARRLYDDPHRPGPPAEYEEATWTSDGVSPGFGFTELVASWNARTPPGTWIEVALRTDDPRGPSPWRVMGRWAESDTDVLPTSVPGQDDDRGTVDVDRLTLPAATPGSTYRIRVSLLRRPGLDGTATVGLLGCVASDVPARGRGRKGVASRAERAAAAEPGSPAAVAAAGHPPTVTASAAMAGAGTGTGTEAETGRVLDVPAYSQRLHLWAYPEWGDGGRSWCSPTSTAMVLDYWGLGPSPADYAWVAEDLPDRFVPYAARHTLDHAYGSAGNWSFNAAYAARFGARAFVTRLRSLAEAELFVAARIPLVVGVAFTRDQLDGAGYDTHGHLAVLVGFDAAGNVVCNDPASHGIPSNDEVRTTFDREQFERAWMRASGGITYVIRPPGTPLPQPPEEPNW